MEIALIVFILLVGSARSLGGRDSRIDEAPAGAATSGDRSRTAQPHVPARIGRMPEIRSIGVVGLGAMGAGIAQLAIEAGYDTVGREVTDELGEAAAARIGHFLTRKVEKGQLEQEERDAAVARLTRHRRARGARRTATS